MDGQIQLGDTMEGKMPLNEGSYFNRMEIAWGKMIDGFMGRDGERWRPLPC